MMGTHHDKARELVRQIRNAGFSVYYDEARNPSYFPMATVEVSLGIPNVLPAQAQGDVMIQLHETAGGKLSSDIIKVSYGREVDAINACNWCNSLARYIRFYVGDGYFSSGEVIIADYDFDYWDYSFANRVISAMREMKEVVNRAYPALRSAAS